MVREQLLDIEKTSVSLEGVTNFYWPISSSEIYFSYLRLLEKLVNYIRESKKQNIKGSDSLIILYRYFILEAVSMYEAFLLLSRSQRDNVKWKAIERNPWVNQLANRVQENQSPDISPILQRLKQGPSTLSKIKAPLRFVRDVIVSKKENMARRSLSPCDFKKDIISMTLNPLAVEYAEESPDRVCYRRDQFWFDQPKKTLSADSYKNLTEGFLDCIASVLKDLPDYLLSFFRNWLETAIPLSEEYLEQLAQKKLAPQRLWVSTSGHLWGSIVARHVKQQGGEVTRFDHGSGCGYFASSHAQGVHDYEDCDVYVTFSKNQASHMSKCFIGNEVVQTRCPEIISIRHPSRLGLARTVKAACSPKKIMYVASIYPNGYFYPGAEGFMRNHVLLDWEIRFMSALQGWGYDTLFKPHPVDSICLSPPESIERLFGPITLKKNFEEVYHQADVVVLDDPSTTLLNCLLISDKPFVYLDFGVVNFSEHALSLLKKRCAIVKGSFNAGNRAQIDWSDLKAALENAWRYTDNQFYNYYF